MKPKIGIIMRKSRSASGKNIGLAYDELIKSISKSKGIPIAIPNDDIYQYLDICNGFIFQGGDDIDKKNIEIINYLRKHNIPTLGICLGMQEMALSEYGDLIDIPKHNYKELHEITIIPGSLLAKIVGTNKTMVNSRHKSSVKYSSLLTSSIASDNIIESVEDPNHKFFLGLQWHPESMYNSDIHSRKIFDYFIKICHD